MTPCLSEPQKFTNHFLTKSKFKFLGSGCGIISQCEAQLLLSFFRDADPTSVHPSDPAVSMLQGKSKRLLMSLLNRAETDTSIRDILSGTAVQPSPSTPIEQTFYHPIYNDEEENDTQPWGRSDTNRTDVSMAWTEENGSEDDDGWVMFGYMSDEDGIKKGSNDGIDKFFDDDLSSISEMEFGLVSESDGGCWSSSLDSTPERSPQPVKNAFRFRNSLPVRRASRQRSRIDFGPWLDVPLHHQQQHEDIDGMKNDDCRSVMSDTSVLLYSPADTPPPPSCAILTELYIHSAKSRHRI